MPIVPWWEQDSRFVHTNLALALEKIRRQILYAKVKSLKNGEVYAFFFAKDSEPNTQGHAAFLLPFLFACLSQNCRIARYKIDVLIILIILSH